MPDTTIQPLVSTVPPIVISAVALEALRETERRKARRRPERKPRRRSARRRRY